MSIFRTSISACVVFAASVAFAQAPPADTRDEAPPKEIPTVVAPAVQPAPAVPTIGPNREIRIGEHFAMKVGLQAQVWANTMQDINPQMMAAGEDSFQNSVYLRRARLMTSVRPWDNIELFLLVEGSDLGKPAADGTKNSSMAILDAFGEVKLHDAFIITAGQQLVPIARNILQGTTTYLGLDIGNTSAATFAPGNPLQTSVLRDAGLQIKGVVLNDRLEYRVGVFSGIREKAVIAEGNMDTASENLPRFAGYLQYNFLDPDKGYVFNGTYYGKKSIAGLAIGGDFQKGKDLDAYRAYSAAAFAAIPIFGKDPKGADEIAALVQYVFYDGQETAPTLLKQHGILAELAYYNRATKLSVFGKYEEKRFVDNAFDDDSNADNEKRGNLRWFGGGVKYHLLDNLCNFTLAYNRTELPNLPMPADARTSVNQFTLAAQLLYY